MLLALASGLESGEESYGEKAEEGTTQGVPLSGPFFCVVIHKLVRKADLILRNSVGMVRYGWDDGYLLGKKKKVFQALEEFSRQVQMGSGLVLQASKSVVYTLLTGDMSPGSTSWINSSWSQAGRPIPCSMECPYRMNMSQQCWTTRLMRVKGKWRKYAMFWRLQDSVCG